MELSTHMRSELPISSRCHQEKYASTQIIPLFPLLPPTADNRKVNNSIKGWWIKTWGGAHLQDGYHSWILSLPIQLKLPYLKVEISNVISMSWQELWSIFPEKWAYM